MRKISENTFELQVKIGTTSQRRSGFTMVDDCIDDYRIGRAVKDTFRKLTALIRLCGGSCDWPRRRIAAHMDMPESTYNRHRRVLEYHGLIAVKRNRLQGCRMNENNLLTIPVGGIKKTPQKRTEKNLKTNTSPLPPKGGERVDVQIEKIEPERPVPSAAVHVALQQAREFRQQRKAERRQRRHLRARQHKRELREVTPADRAVNHIMAVLCVAPGMRLTRDGIKTSVVRWMAETGKCAEAAANGLIAAWKDYELLARGMEYPCGVLTWFSECRWGQKWFQQRVRINSTVGPWQEPAVLDTRSLREKMKALLGDWDAGMDEDADDADGAAMVSELPLPARRGDQHGVSGDTGRG